ncbi:hypothetical protein [Flammeovirga sp. OC4]|uniref:hypothetical protein n=1 Tax=Flammeovirga sp. OC4 TaxID=1382345 RepID=UPI0005C6CAC7|nr:hypothetical protein [Flammeovirga sp. OC4]
MKTRNLKTILFLAFSTIMTLVSCEKNEVDLNQASDSLTIEQLIESMNGDEVFDMTNTLISNQRSLFPINNGSLIENKYAYRKLNSFGAGFESTFKPGDILCEGSGYDFAKCVKKQLDNGFTLRLYKEGKTSFAEEL